MSAVTVAAAMREALRTFDVAANVRADRDRDRITVTPRLRAGFAAGDTRFGEQGQRAVRQCALLLGLSRPRGLPLYVDGVAPDDDRIMVFTLTGTTNRHADRPSADRRVAVNLAWLIAEHERADRQRWDATASTLFDSLPIGRVVDIAAALRALLDATGHEKG